MPEETYPNDLIRYVYDDSTPYGSEENAVFIQTPEIEEEYYELHALKSMIEKAESAPRQKTVDRILEFSRNFNLESIS
jgi:hypothetical protein